MIVVLPLSHFIYSAVTVSPELAKWPKRLTSGELRIGLRRHKLICGKDGTLRQEFPNVVYVLRPFSLDL